MRSTYLNDCQATKDRDDKDDKQFRTAQTARTAPGRTADNDHVHSQMSAAPGHERRAQERDPDQDIDFDLVDAVQGKAGKT